MENFKQYTILYVEDDEGVRKINSRFLTRMFYKLYEARDGIEALEIYKKHNPDIILTDINMPQMNGIELTKAIRKNDKETRIIISTAFSDKNYLLDAIELNLEKYIIKPLTSRNLIPALMKAVDNLENLKEKKIYLSDDFYFDTNLSLFFLNEEEIKLTKKELLFLKFLTLNKDRIVLYEEIEQYVWEDEQMSLNSLRTSIGFLRKKLPFNCIKNVSNMGYKLNLEKKL